MAKRLGRNRKARREREAEEAELHEEWSLNFKLKQQEAGRKRQELALADQKAAALVWEQRSCLTKALTELGFPCANHGNLILMELPALKKLVAHLSEDK